VAYSTRVNQKMGPALGSQLSDALDQPKAIAGYLSMILIEAVYSLTTAWRIDRPDDAESGAPARANAPASYPEHLVGAGPARHVMPI